MSVSLGANGSNYNYPETGELSWGANATNFASAVSAALAKLGLGSTLSTDAVIDITSTSKGIRIPSMTTTQRNAIATPATGLLIFNTTTNRINFYYSGWKEIIINGETSNVGIGTDTPLTPLMTSANTGATNNTTQNMLQLDSITSNATFGTDYGNAILFSVTRSNTDRFTISKIIGKKFSGGHSDNTGGLQFVTYNSGTPVNALSILGNGYVGIGNISPVYQLELSTDSAGKLSTNVWTITSDERIKDNIVLADIDRCYEIVKKLPLKKYKWKYYSEQQAPDQNMLGWIAQDVQTYFPKAVNVSKFKISETESIDDCLNLNSDQINKVLYGAVQKLQVFVETQQAKILELENRINTLEGN